MREPGDGVRTPAARATSLTLGVLVMALLGAIAPGHRPAVLAAPVDTCVADVADVIGWWRGEDDLTGQTGPDLSGSVPFTEAAVRRGMAFDGASTVTTSALPTVAEGVAFEAWVRPVANGLVQTIVSRWDELSGDDSTRSFALRLGPTGELIWMTDEISTQRPVEQYVIVPDLADGDFHHVAVTWSLAETAVYVDGVLVDSRVSQGLPLNGAPATEFRLGSQTGLGNPFYFTGVLDEPTVWRRAITPAEVAAIHAAGPEGKCTFVPVQRAKLLPPGGTSNGWFGFAVDVDSTSIIVGAPLQNAANVFSGAAYVFTLEGGGWVQQQRLVASDAGLSDQLGWSVAISGDTAVVGSYGNNGGGTDSGAAYVFTRAGTVWTQAAKLLADDASAGDGFGYAVAIDGDTIAVGAPGNDDAGSNSGAAYVFVRGPAGWSQEAKLVATGASAGDDHGASVAVAGDTVVVGRPGADAPGANAGSASVYVRAAASWVEQAALSPAGLAAGDEFGTSVAIDGDAVIGGSPFDDDAGDASGSAHVFVRTTGVWSQQAALTAADAATGARFGVGVAIDGGTAVAGAYQDAGTASQSGSAYVFNRSTGVWEQLTKLQADDAAAGDRFGVAVAISGDIVVGAYLDDDQGSNSGGTYVFSG